jgi:hypothetical protein
MEKARTYTLGQLIADLEVLDQDKPIRFNFGYFTPCGIGSWRGSYSELALGYDTKSEWKVSDLFAACRDALGKTFMGYKGGEYTMSRTTEVWIDNYGEASSTGLVEIIDVGWQYVLRADYRRF